MAGPTYVTTGALVDLVGTTGGQGNTISVPLPTGAVNVGDILISALTIYGSASTIVVTPPSGWTSVGVAFSNATSEVTSQLFWCSYTNGLAAPTFTWSSNTMMPVGMMLQFTGANTIAPIGNVGTWSVGAASPCTTTAVTTTHGNSLAVLAAFSEPASDTNLATPTNWTVGWNVYDGNIGEHLGGVTRAIAASGASSGTTSSVFGSSWMAFQFELLSGPVTIPAVAVGATAVARTDSSITVPSGSFTFLDDPVITYLLAHANTLPTTLPGTSDTVWSDGGVICYTGSPPSSSTFYYTPTTKPSNNYVWWLDGGVFSVTGSNFFISTNYFIPSAANTSIPIWNDNGVLCVSSIYAGSTVYTTEVASATVGLGTLYEPDILTQVHATASVGTLGNLYVNTGSLAQANTNATANVLFSNIQVNAASVSTITAVGSVTGNLIFLIPTTNATGVVGSLFGNVQVTSPITNATTSTGSLTGYGLSQANTSVSVTSFTPQVSVAASITNAIAVVHSLGNLYVNVAAQITNATAGYGLVFDNVQVTSLQANTNATANILFSNIQVTLLITNATASANTVYGLDISAIAEANASVSIAGVSKIVQVNAAITNATGSAVSPIALGIAEANASVSVGSAVASVQVTAAITNATSSATALTTSTATTYTPAQATASAIVNPLTNFYVNTGALAQANASTVVHSLGNLYVNVVPSQANVNATTNVLYGLGISQVNTSVTVSSIFGNVQVTVPITNATTSAAPLIGFGISEANATVTIASVFGNVQVTVPITNATVSATSLTTSSMASGSYTPAQVNVVATVNPFGNLYVNTGILT